MMALGTKTGHCVRSSTVRKSHTAYGVSYKYPRIDKMLSNYEKNTYARLTTPLYFKLLAMAWDRQY